jgi:uncharacterized membrane protein HdeD (DUF308 family)
MREDFLDALQGRKDNRPTHPLTIFGPMQTRKNPQAPSEAPASKAEKEILFKGVACALIGLVVLIGPYLAKSPSVRDMMAQAAVVGWFALVLGLAFVVQFGLRRKAALRRKPND